jgi:peroxiredoxin
MKRNLTKTFSAVMAVVAVLFMVACTGKSFNISGNITEAKDSVLYLENMSLSGPVVVDSVKLGESGSFSFSQQAPEAPEFYRLRIADQIINISIDSTETVTVKATYPTMAAQYEISGSENCKKIQELTLLQMQLQQRAIAIQRDVNIGVDEANDSILKLIDQYKENVKRNYIFKEPNKSYAYFALFQTLGNWLIFNPRMDKDDVKAFAAVATSWDTYYPNAERGQNLHNIALEGMKNSRIIEAKNNQSIDANKVSSSGLIDLQMKDNKGVTRRLSDLKGQVVMLDFHIFAMNDSPKRILMLRELYNKYHAQGFEIYQVSLDDNEHFWKQQTAALPWCNVRDDDGSQASKMALYNIQTVPAFFLIDRDNNLVKRAENIKDLEAEIQALL